MAYTQKSNPFIRTSCGRRYAPLSIQDQKTFDSPFNMRKKGPCWKGYEMIGTKKKSGRTVPNCVPIKK